jgi:hypothetical protein
MLIKMPLSEDERLLLIYAGAHKKVISRIRDTTLQ